jgi:hypothetical protein
MTLGVYTQGQRLAGGNGAVVNNAVGWKITGCLNAEAQQAPAQRERTTQVMNKAM